MLEVRSAAIFLAIFLVAQAITKQSSNKPRHDSHELHHARLTRIRGRPLDARTGRMACRHNTALDSMSSATKSRQKAKGVADVLLYLTQTWSRLLCTHRWAHARPARDGGSGNRWGATNPAVACRCLL